MSKIYEALQRAEQERAQHNPSEPSVGILEPPVLAAAPVQATATDAAVAAPLNGMASAPVTLPRVAASVIHAVPPPVAPALPSDSPRASEFARVPEPYRAPASNGHYAAAPAFTLPAEALVAAEALPVEPAPPTLPKATEYVWYPVFDKLPALQARGKDVEQFRSLRSKLFEFRDLNPLKSLLISSGRPEEGKSFVAVNLAISLARHRSSRVLLIDGDLRRGSLHHLLGAPNEHGLAEFLAGKATLNQLMQRGKPAPGSTMPQTLAAMTFIPSGNGGDRSADLSASHRFPELIAAVSSQFDWVVVDSSPVNLVADGANLARACDGVLLITRGGVTKYETAQRALVELKASKVLGVVLNAVKDPPKVGGYYGYDTYDSRDLSHTTEAVGDAPAP